MSDESVISRVEAILVRNAPRAMGTKDIQRELARDHGRVELMAISQALTRLHARGRATRPSRGQYAATDASLMHGAPRRAQPMAVRDADILRRVAAGEQQAALAREYGISRERVRQIRIRDRNERGS